MKYNFVKLEARYTRGFQGLYIGKNSVHIRPEAYGKIGSPKKIAIYFDSKTRVIKIEQDELGRIVTILPHGKSAQFSCRISNVMPIGKYLFDEVEKVFIYKP